MSHLEEALALQIRAVELPEPEREFRFHHERKWRFDFAFPDAMLAVEVEGGVYFGGRHTRGSGFVKDCEKYNRAVMAGWRVLRFPACAIDDGSAINMIELALLPF